MSSRFLQLFLRHLHHLIEPYHHYLADFQHLQHYHCIKLLQIIMHSLLILQLYHPHLQDHHQYYKIYHLHHYRLHFHYLHHLFPNYPKVYFLPLLLLSILTQSPLYYIHFALYHFLQHLLLYYKYLQVLLYCSHIILLHHHHPLLYHHHLLHHPQPSKYHNYNFQVV